MGFPESLRPLILSKAKFFGPYVLLEGQKSKISPHERPCFFSVVVCWSSRKRWWSMLIKPPCGLRMKRSRSPLTYIIKRYDGPQTHSLFNLHSKSQIVNQKLGTRSWTSGWPEPCACTLSWSQRIQVWGFSIIIRPDTSATLLLCIYNDTKDRNKRAATAESTRTHS